MKPDRLLGNLVGLRDDTCKWRQDRGRDFCYGRSTCKGSKTTYQAKYWLDLCSGSIAVVICYLPLCLVHRFGPGCAFLWAALCREAQNKSSHTPCVIEPIVERASCLLLVRLRFDKGTISDLCLNTPDNPFPVSL